MSEWFQITNASDVASPTLLLYPDRIRENIRGMIRIAGGPTRLRPHIKTHKLAELVQMQIEEGITKFKCATIAEAELAASAGAKEAANVPTNRRNGRMISAHHSLNSGKSGSSSSP